MAQKICVFFESPFVRNDHLTRQARDNNTYSGNEGTLRQRDVFADLLERMDVKLSVRFSYVFLRHLYLKMNILPRQARDKHRENSKKD